MAQVILWVFSAGFVLWTVGWALAGYLHSEKAFKESLDKGLSDEDER